MKKTVIMVLAVGMAALLLMSCMAAPETALSLIHILGWGGQDDMLSVGRDAVTQKTVEFIDMFGSAGKAGIF